MGVAIAADYRGVFHRRLACRPFAVFAAFGCIAIALYFALPSARGPVYIILGLSAAIAVFAAVALHRPPRPRPWLLLGGSLTCFISGDLLADIGFGSAHRTALYLVAYALVGAAVVLLFRPAAPGDALGMAVDSAIGAAAFAALQAIVVLAPALNGPDVERAVESLVHGWYPVLDMVLLIGLLGAGARGWPLPAYRLLVAAFVVTLVGDEGLALTAGGTAAGVAFDLCWLSGYVLVGSAALHPSMRQLTGAAAFDEAWLIRLRVVLVGAGLLLPPVLLVVLIQTDEHALMRAVVVGVLAVALLVLLRIAGMLRRAERLRRAEHWPALRRMPHAPGCSRRTTGCGRSTG